MRRLVCENVNNLRDLGGYLTKDNKVTKFNSIYRSSLPKEMSNDEVKYLLDNKLSTVIDLRKKEDVALEKNCLNIPQVQYFNVGLLGDKCPNIEKDIPKGYMEIINDKNTMYKLFSIILNASGSILFNCSAGKDRTGVVSMLILLLANVYEDDIIADYEISYVYVRNDMRKLHNDNPNLPSFLGQSKLEYMERTLQLFFERYRTIENYFEQLGFNRQTIEDLKAKIV